MDNRQLYLVGYDISHRRRLRAALVCVRRHATGGQKSVHECWLSAVERDELLMELSLIIEPEADSVFVLRLDPRQRPFTLGIAISPDNADVFYLG